MGTDWLDETHRRVGAICHRSTWLEYQLEIAYMELADTDDLTATQGQWYSALIKMIKQVLARGVVIHDGHEVALRDLLSRISKTMKLRDRVVHSTWIRKNSTKPGHVTGQRWYRNREETRDWTMAELDQIAHDLQALADELSTTAWNAIKPPEQWV
ncbi:hypothetical protein [Nocardioides sp. cx-173]|uniref:hypothetical protein n=1 Tax=Nocardioides sp. cx-173 TaxID=2898796 RepID=UPI001E516A3A|nr:hypothetical protein [Nocardioides sp. cx-173]MCD4524022.1 hypothetical protein [Nocardioides sp. cx-173]UGB41423.1 hypothetical protein LQ940_18895 [Nocardioides sp. cx-173]